MAPGTPLTDAIADLRGFCVEPEPRYNRVYSHMYGLQSFHATQHDPALVGLLERMMGGKVLPHPRIIGRTIFPKREAYTTPPHQDFIPIQGTPQTYTAWFPLADLPAQMGGLMVSSGSHRHGIYRFKPALGAGGLQVTDELEGPWVNNPMRQGDVLFFHSHAVHQGVPNRSDRLRMSMDLRYQRIDDPISPDSLMPHIKEVLTWDQIYADWPNDDYKYYWKAHQMQLVPFDTRYYDERDKLAMEIAGKGDATARSALQRIIARDPDPGKVERARQLLTSLDEPQQAGSHS